MPADPPPRLLPSFLDRLTDPSCMGTAGAPGYDERQMMNAVRKDLEELLNTRMTGTDVPADCAEVRDSMATYGLPDLVSYSSTSADQCADLARVIERIIARFEPRLRAVRVRVGRGADAAARSVRFQIDAALNVDPAPTIGFVTVIEMTTGRATVKADGDRA